MSYLDKNLLYIIIIFSVFVGLVPQAAEFLSYLSQHAPSVALLTGQGMVVKQVLINFSGSSELP